MMSLKQALCILGAQTWQRALYSSWPPGPLPEGPGSDCPHPPLRGQGCVFSASSLSPPQRDLDPREQDPQKSTGQIRAQKKRYSAHF